MKYFQKFSKCKVNGNEKSPWVLKREKNFIEMILKHLHQMHFSSSKFE